MVLSSALNFLAHIYLSGPDVETRFGNFIGDDIKGKKFELYEGNIRKGILLHRFIDSYTDHNEHTLKVLRILRPGLGKLSGVAVDVFNDHFLALKWKVFSNEDLTHFCQTFYDQMDGYVNLMPPRVKRLFYYMKKDDWLSNYRSKSGLSVTFENMARRYKFAEQLKKGPEELVVHYKELSNYFDLFFPELQLAVSEFLADYKG